MQKGPKSYKRPEKQAQFQRIKHAIKAIFVTYPNARLLEGEIRAMVEQTVGTVSDAMFAYALRDSWRYDNACSCFGVPTNWFYTRYRDATFVGVDIQGGVKDLP